MNEAWSEKTNIVKEAASAQSYALWAEMFSIPDAGEPICGSQSKPHRDTEMNEECGELKADTYVFFRFQDVVVHFRWHGVRSICLLSGEVLHLKLDKLLELGQRAPVLDVSLRLNAIRELS